MPIWQSEEKCKQTFKDFKLIYALISLFQLHDNLKFELVSDMKADIFTEILEATEANFTCWLNLYFQWFKNKIYLHQEIWF